ISHSTWTPPGGDHIVKGRKKPLEQVEFDLMWSPPGGVHVEWEIFQLLVASEAQQLIDGGAAKRYAVSLPDPEDNAVDEVFAASAGLIAVEIAALTAKAGVPIEMIRVPWGNEFIRRCCAAGKVPLFDQSHLTLVR